MRVGWEGRMLKYKEAHIALKCWMSNELVLSTNTRLNFSGVSLVVRSIILLHSLANSLFIIGGVVSRNNLGAEGVAAIGKALEHNDTLTTLT
jgi:hypothetical protein